MNAGVFLRGASTATPRGASALELTPVSSGQLWDRLVSGRSLATPFHTSTFLTEFARRWDLRLELLAASVDGRMIGGVPLLSRSKLGLRWVNHLNQFSYLGPAVDDEYLGVVLAGLARRRGATTMRERQEARVAPDQAPDVAGWTRRTATTYVVPLAGRTAADVEAAASKSFRQSPRRAEQNGLVVEPATERDIAVELPALVRAGFDRQGLDVPYDDETYVAVWHELEPRGLATATAVRAGAETVAVTLTLVEGRRAYGWVTAADPAHRKAEPSMAGHRAEILKIHAAGLDEYDLIGGSTPGIAAFKRSLGGEEQEFTVFERGRRV